MNQNKERFIGQWVDNFIPGDIIHRMKLVNGKIILEIFSPSENFIDPFPTELKKSIVGKHFSYVNIDDPTEYYILEQNGDLSVYDKDGFVVTYTCVK